MTTSEETRMTRAPAPALTAVLDELDELRAKATPGPWEQDALWPLDFGPEGDLQHGTVNSPADAALIVAAVNRLPELTAALRAVLALADELEREAGERERRAERTPGSAPFAADRIRLFAGARHQRLAAAQLRAALASPAPAPQGEELADEHRAANSAAAYQASDGQYGSSR